MDVGEGSWNFYPGKEEMHNRSDEDESETGRAILDDQEETQGRGPDHKW